LLVVGVNHFIQVPSAAEQQYLEQIQKLPEDWQSSPRTIILAGYDGVPGTKYDFVKRLEKDAENPLSVPDQVTLNQIASKIISQSISANNSFPRQQRGNEIVSSFRDIQNKPLRYEIMNANAIRIRSAGGDGKWNTKWDTGIIISKADDEPAKSSSWFDAIQPQKTWLSERKKALGIKTTADAKSAEDLYTKTTFSGGQPKLQGAKYFWFFSGLMGLTSILFIPFAMIYRPKNYLQE
jgi:POT family proton-dependent oligopeptide transporter